MSIIIAIILFSIIVIFHELGHFLLAKANGIKVNEFSLGLGPTIFGFTKGETTYSLKLLPFGGACMMEGEDENSTDERAFSQQSVWARISVVFAGPFFNFIMAFVFAFIIIACVGYDEPVVSGVIPGYAAEEAGMQEGDEIVKINNYNVHFFKEVSLYSAFHAGEDVTITYKRDGEKFETVLKPKLSEETNTYLYGFSGTNEKVKPSFGKIVSHSFYEVRYWIYYVAQSLRMLVTGGASVNDLSGPVGIVKNIGDTYTQSVSNDGYFYAFLNMLNWGTMLSANLGVMNLLPLPALDGGRLVFLIIEAIRRKKVDPDKEGMVHFAGIVLLLLLMVVIMFNDIRKLF
ncbi:MAG: RIP metalloprotease RseP [Agathobacter sp.]|nr:RIP metalloprotease RseP [Agathobacter sp.]